MQGQQSKTIKSKADQRAMRFEQHTYVNNSTQQFPATVELEEEADDEVRIQSQNLKQGSSQNKRDKLLLKIKQ